MIGRRRHGASGHTPEERDDWTLEVEPPRQEPAHQNPPRPNPSPQSRPSQNPPRQNPPRQDTLGQEPPTVDRWDDPDMQAEQERWRESHPLQGGASYGPIAGTSARPKPSKAAKVAQAGVTVGHGLTKGAKVVAHGTSVVGHSAYRVTHKATHAGGAGQTGLSRLIEIHGLHNAGDAVVAISLAGSLFFSVPTGEARGQVLLFLLLTLLPFSIIAPFVGPFLDRFRHGRRWAIGSMMALRGVLCLILASSLNEAAWWQFPVALGILVASKAYNVTRSAATPRLLPDGMTLVKANGRMSMAGVVGAAVAAPVAVGISYIGSVWSLGFAFLIFALGTVLAILLPPAVDSTKGESQVPMAEFAGRQSRWVPPPVVNALRANVGLRMLSGFLTIFLAFLLRESPPPGWGGNFTLLIGLVAAAVGLGSAIGTLLGSLTKLVPPRALVRLALIIDVVAAVATAINFGMVTVLILSTVVGMCQQLGKLALDAVIQESVPEHSRTSVFGRSETLIQLAWVIGGGLAVVLPADATIGMSVIAVVLVAWLIVVLLPPRASKAKTSAPAPARPPSD